MVLCSLLCFWDPAWVWGCFTSFGWLIIIPGHLLAEAGYHKGDSFLICPESAWACLCMAAGTCLYKICSNAQIHIISTFTVHHWLGMYALCSLLSRKLALPTAQTCLFLYPATNHWWTVCRWGPSTPSCCSTAARCVLPFNVCNPSVPHFHSSITGHSTPTNSQPVVAVYWCKDMCK